jgi:hypothetical protein
MANFQEVNSRHRPAREQHALDGRLRIAGQQGLETAV